MQNMPVFVCRLPVFEKVCIAKPGFVIMALTVQPELFGNKLKGKERRV